MDDLLKLAERCEAATGPDPHLWGLITLATGCCKKVGQDPTRSLDAAMLLVPEGMLFAFTNCDTKFSEPDFSRCSAVVGHADDPNEPSVAATPALALCAASLRARIGDGGVG